MGDEKHARKVFWINNADNLYVIRLQILANPDGAARQIHSMRVETCTQKNAIAWLSERLQDAVIERDQLERDLANMTDARRGADNAVHALSEKLKLVSKRPRRKT